MGVRIWYIEGESITKMTVFPDQATHHSDMLLLHSP